MTTTTELTIKAREVIFNEMAPVTREVALEGLNRLQTGYQIALLVQYDLGTLVNTIYSDESLSEDQRRHEIRRLADYWNQPRLQPSTLYDLRNVAAAFDRDFIKAQVEERMSNGNYLTWSHFKELQKVGSEKRQLSLLKKIRQHCWSSKELALELQGKKESEIQRTGGRKPGLPKTPNAMLQKIFTSVQQTDNYLEAMSEPLDGIFMEMAPQEVDARFVESLDNTLERLNVMEKHLDQTRTKLQKVRTRATMVMGSPESVLTLAAKKSVVEPVDDSLKILMTPTTERLGVRKKVPRTVRS
jgi:hypothetical protein